MPRSGFLSVRLRVLAAVVVATAMAAGVFIATQPSSGEAPARDSSRDPAAARDAALEACDAYDAVIDSVVHNRSAGGVMDLIAGLDDSATAAYDQDVSWLRLLSGARALAAAFDEDSGELAATATELLDAQCARARAGE